MMHREITPLAQGLCLDLEPNAALPTPRLIPYPLDPFPLFHHVNDPRLQPTRLWNRDRQV